MGKLMGQEEEQKQEEVSKFKTVEDFENLLQDIQFLLSNVYDIENYKEELEQFFLAKQSEIFDRIAEKLVKDYTQYYNFENIEDRVLKDLAFYFEDTMYEDIKVEMLNKIKNEKNMNNRDKETLRAFINTMIEKEINKPHKPKMIAKFENIFLTSAYDIVKKAFKKYQSICIVIKINNGNTNLMYKVYATEFLEDEDDCKNILRKIDIDLSGKNNYTCFVVNEENYKKYLRDLNIAALYLTNENNFQKILIYKPKKKGNL